jgi:hypothetical protein
MNYARFALFLSAAAIVAVLTVLSSKPVVAHGGGLDGLGCHNDKKVGNYHCHRGSCAGKTFASKEAAAKAGCKL